jgi:hypothetical protein
MSDLLNLTKKIDKIEEEAKTREDKLMNMIEDAKRREEEAKTREEEAKTREDKLMKII